MKITYHKALISKLYKWLYKSIRKRLKPNKKGTNWQLTGKKGILNIYKDAWAINNKRNEN